jgi:hypothetical protein
MKTNRLLVCSLATGLLGVAALLAVHSNTDVPVPAAPHHERAVVAAADSENIYARPLLQFAVARDDSVRLDPRLQESLRAAPAQYALQTVPVSLAPEKPPFYEDPNFIGWAIGTLSAIAAVLMRRDASRKSKALNAVIVGVERAMQLPQAQAAAKHVKDEIQRFAVANGVEDHLAQVVQQLTSAMPKPAVGEVVNH